MVWFDSKQIRWSMDWMHWLGNKLAPLCAWAKNNVNRIRSVCRRMSVRGPEPVRLEMLRATQIASADTLWKIVNNLADLEQWHPLVTGTNAPRGQQAKPGLIYRTMSRYLPLSTQVFVERVLPGELLSMRLFPLPGLQERVTYRIISTLCGTCVLYSITLSGWLSPFAWPVVKPQVIKVATALVEAAELETTGQWREKNSLQKSRSLRSHQRKDIFE
ncbi:MAG: SRPBCC family protein [Cyanobacteria bacterium P01_D01_bin.105]